MHNAFTHPLLQWYDQNGRKNLPWQHHRLPYPVWISEIMLQQTQVQTVIPYFLRFMEKFPTLAQLACADIDEVLSLWSGLGYYSRARNIHKTAQIIMSQYQGDFPDERHILLTLPGIGESTAAAILSQAFGQKTAVLDGNVKRVLCRWFMVAGYPEKASVKKQLFTLANQCMSAIRCADYTQAIMDLGATCCTSKNPQCNQCPIQPGCKAYQQDKISEYPHKKPARTLPEKHEQFLVLTRRDGRIYFEKRPPVGIWGGLWCFPTLERGSDCEQFATAHYRCQVLSQKPLVQLCHVFSHFKLHIDSRLLQVENTTDSLCEARGKWFDRQQASELGLAKPVRIILESLTHPLFD